MKKFLFFILITITSVSGSFGANKINDLDALVFWQPEAIKEALIAMNVTEEQFSKFVNLYYKKINTAYSTQRLSSFDVLYLWFNVFANVGSDGHLSEEDIDLGQDFLVHLITKQNEIVENLEKSNNIKAESNEYVLSTEKAAEIFERSQYSCEPNYINQFNLLYTNRGLSLPRTKGISTNCVPIKGTENGFSCIYERTFATGSKDTLCTIACNEVYFTKEYNDYSINTKDCEPVSITRKQNQQIY